MSNLILLIILWSFLECAYKKIPIYEEFITGVKEGMHYLMILFPSIMLLTLWVNLFLSIGAMIINPKVLLLDEPFNYLDPSSQMTIAHMIQRICKEHGTTVIISSHNLNFVADISTRILLLEKGKLVKDLPNADGAAIAELNEYFGIQAE